MTASHAVQHGVQQRTCQSDRRAMAAPRTTPAQLSHTNDGEYRNEEQNAEEQEDPHQGTLVATW